MSFIRASGLGPLTASNTATIVDPATPVNGIARMSPLVSFSPVTVSGTSVGFTNIPSWVRRITVMLNGVSTSGTSIIQIQIGDSGGIETSGYVGAVGNRGAENYYTSGYLINRGYTASSTGSGLAILTLVSGNIWVISGTTASSAVDAPNFFAGTKTLSDTLTQILVTTVNGTDTFDAGTINVMYE